MLKIDISKRLGGFNLNATLDAPPGVTALFGRSGSGKTSIINAVAGLMTPDDGRIEVDGKVLFDATTNVAVHHRGIGYVFQDARLFPHLTVLQNLRFGGCHDETRVIDLLGIGSLLQRKPAGLSGGERQRVALGRALMRNPRVLLLDEPLAALDGRRKAEILPYLEELRAETRMPILYVTHDISEVARLATTLALIEDGQITKVGSAAAVMSDPDAVPLLGVQDAGALIEAVIEAHLPDDHLSKLRFDGGTLLLPRVRGDVGQDIRLRIAAQDVILSKSRPEGVSALNVLPVVISHLSPGRGPGVAVGLQCGNTPLLARVTARSMRELGLREGMSLFAVLKATAVGPADVGNG